MKTEAMTSSRLDALRENLSRDIYEVLNTNGSIVRALDNNNIRFTDEKGAVIWIALLLVKWEAKTPDKKEQAAGIAGGICKAVQKITEKAKE